MSPIETVELMFPWGTCLYDGIKIEFITTILQAIEI